MNKHKLVIIGAGPAGLTAAIYSARAELKPLVIEGPMPGGQLMGTSFVENWPGEEKILGFDLMMKIKEQSQKCGAQFLSEKVIKVDFKNRPFKIYTESKEIIADAVIIATGSSPKKIGCPGEEEYWGKGVTTCAVCDGAFYKNKPVLIVGGGDTAMEDASFMTKFTNDITVVQILDHLTASKPMQSRVISNPNIKIILNSSVKEFLGEENKLSEVKISNNKTKEETYLKIDGAFIAIGQNPQTDFLKGQLELTEWGLIKIHDQTKTSVQGVFAAGDVSDPIYKQAITSAGTGCKAALDAEKYLSNS